MQSNHDITPYLDSILSETKFDFLSQRYVGKVRDTYRLGAYRILVTTDRFSCFDRVLTTVPFKGQILNSLANFWFDATKDVVPNHIVATIDPNVVVATNCSILPIEVIVRGYLAGSAWRDYQAGKTISGIQLSPDLQPYSKFPQPLVTPATKAPKGAHDESISETELISRGLVPKPVWDEVRELALALFARGSDLARKQGLILADTKYEFGMVDGHIILADELHTLDSSRYWLANTYQERLRVGQSPEMLDKEPTRQWLLAQGFSGDGAIPHFTDQHRVELMSHYQSSYEKVTGLPFSPVLGNPLPRIEEAIRKFTSEDRAEADRNQLSPDGSPL